METSQLLDEGGGAYALVTEDYGMQKPMDRLELMYKLWGNDK